MKSLRSDERREVKSDPVSKFHYNHYIDPEVFEKANQTNANAIILLILKQTAVLQRKIQNHCSKETL